MTNSLYRRLARLLAVIAISLTILGGCGQKGPLYLPGNPSEIKTEVPKQESGREAGQDLPEAEPEDEDDETPDEQP